MSDIKLFRFTQGGAEELPGRTALVEPGLQALMERHMECFLGVRFVAHEYATGRVHRGRIDSLGLDENNCPVILEYKRRTNENVINQGLYYLDWLLDHKAEFKLLVLERYGIRLPVFGMVKDSRHRTRAITSQDEEIAISANRGVFALVTSIQDEVHRYSIEFSRKSHGKSSMATRLMELEGIGEPRAAALYRHFKTYKAIGEATVEELAQVKGMTRPAAEKLYGQLHEMAEKD